jgi:hypothetical protein
VPKPPPAATEFPGGRPLDAAQISTGRLAVERMPSEVTSALEAHADEIVTTAELVETKQSRIRGTCAPGSAIRVVHEDGTVACERLPRAVVSVSALGGVARQATTRTVQGAIAGAVGRYQVEGDEDFLVVPVQLPDGAIVTSFAYRSYDASPKVDGAAYLYRSDDVVLAAVATEGASEAMRTVTTDDVRNARVDNRAHAYFVYMRLSAYAGADVMPVGASVAYRLP